VIAAIIIIDATNIERSSIAAEVVGIQIYAEEVVKNTDLVVNTTAKAVKAVHSVTIVAEDLLKNKSKLLLSNLNLRDKFLRLKVEFTCPRLK